MPSPVGHFLGGVGAGLAVVALAAPSANRSEGAIRAELHSAVRRMRSFRWLMILGVLGARPDVDFLFGTHSTYTHSIGATGTIGCVAAVVARRARWVTAMAIGAAYASHVALDWLGSDSVSPIGVMALWPLSSAFFQSDLHFFPPVRREYWLDGFIVHTMRTLVFELVTLGSIAALVFWRTGRLSIETENEEVGRDHPDSCGSAPYS